MMIVLRSHDQFWFQQKTVVSEQIQSKYKHAEEFMFIERLFHQWTYNHIHSEEEESS